MIPDRWRRSARGARRVLVVVLVLPLVAVLVTCRVQSSRSSRPPEGARGHTRPATWTPLPRPAPAEPQPVVSLEVRNPDPVERLIPVDAGVPLPLGLELTTTEALTLLDAAGTSIPVQIEPRMRWGGVPVETSSAPLRWIGVSFQARVPAKSTATYRLSYGGTRPDPVPSIRVDLQDGVAVVDTGPARFRLRRDGADLFEQVQLRGRPLVGVGNGLFVTDLEGRRYKTVWRGDSLRVESSGPLEALLTMSGTLVPMTPGGAGSGWLEFDLRMRFAAGLPSVTLDFTLRNPRAAQHPSNVWVLGDRGSALFSAVSLELPLIGDHARYALSAEGGAPLTGSGRITLLQDSSGGPAWQSKRHVQRDGKLAVRFRGYRISRPGQKDLEGLQAQPALSLMSAQGGLTVSLDDFWQNFPKGLEASDSRLSLHLFPPGSAGGYELQGGEQKTHRIRIWLEAPDQADPAARLTETHDVVPVVPASWWLAARASLLGDIPRRSVPAGGLEATMEAAIRSEGSNPRTYLSAAEAVDAYGWRDYGDVQADHETECGKPAGAEFVSSYNNQYDYVLGAFHQFGRTGDPAWLAFALRTAAHTADIDVYHTREDRPVYNGGMFWHTTHDTAVGLSTHRSFPALEESGKCTEYTSGGPGLGHLYVDGLVVGYLLTGDLRLRDAALELGGFALTRRLLDKSEADGRALGNYLGTLVTLCELTGEERFCGGADEVLPAVMAEVSKGELGFGAAMAGKALGRWLELDEDRSAVAGVGARMTPRAVALKGLMSLCRRIQGAELPMDVNRARFADVMAYGARFSDGPLLTRLWGRRAQQLLESLETGYWGRGTYPNAKELAILLTNGGETRALSPTGREGGGGGSEAAP